MGRNILTQFISFIASIENISTLNIDDFQKVESTLKNSAKINLLPAALSILYEELSVNVLTTKAELALVNSLCLSFNSLKYEFIDKLISGVKLRDLLLEVGLSADMELLYPTMIKIEKRRELHYVREPFRSLLSVRKNTSLQNATTSAVEVSHVPANVKSIVIRYLQFEKPSIISCSPPTSVLHLFSDSIYHPQEVWARRIIGRIFAKCIIDFRVGKVPALNKIHYTTLNTLFKIKDLETEPLPEIPQFPMGDFLKGFYTAMANYSSTNEANMAEMVRNIFPTTFDEKFAGWMVGVGIMGKLSGLTAAEKTGLCSCDLPLMKSTAAYAFSISSAYNGKLDSLMLNFLKMIVLEKPLQPELLDNRIDVEAQLANISPLAFGLGYFNSGNTSAASLLQRLLVEKSVTDPYRLINASFGIALIQGNKENPSLHYKQVERLYSILLDKDSLPTHRLAAIIAIIPFVYSGKFILNYDDFQMDSIGMPVYLVINLLKALKDPSSNDCPSVINYSSLELAVKTTAHILGAAILRLKLASSWMESSIELIHEMRARSRKKALSFNARMERLYYGYCHDIALFSLSLLNAGSCNQILLKELNQSFADSLDYSIHRSIIHSISLALITADRRILGKIQSTDTLILTLHVLALMLPFDQFSLLQDEPIKLFRLLLFFSLFQMNDANYSACTEDSSKECLHGYLSSFPEAYLRFVRLDLTPIRL